MFSPPRKGTFCDCYLVCVEAAYYRFIEISLKRLILSITIEIGLSFHKIQVRPRVNTVLSGAFRSAGHPAMRSSLQAQRQDTPASRTRARPCDIAATPAVIP